MSSNIHSEVQAHLLSKSVTNIGRDAENDIAIVEPIVSGRHAQIVLEGEHLIFIHPHPSREKTLNGLWYQGLGAIILVLMIVIGIFLKRKDVRV